MKKIVISEFMDQAAVDRLKQHFDVTYDAKLVEDRERLLTSLGDAEGLIVRNRTQVDEVLLEAAPRLRIVGRLGVGLDNIDLEACKVRVVKVAPATGANTVAVAEYVIAAALVLVRGTFGASGQVAAGDWPRQSLMGGELYGRVLGLVGYGAIAREVAARARAFGMRILAYDPFLPADDAAWRDAERMALPQLLAEADVISLHVPLTEETRRMIDEKALAGMKREAVLINTARGGIVDEPALVDSLRNGQLGGAALDVFEREPLDSAAGQAFEGLDNLILTPHIAGITGESNIRVSAVVADAVTDALGAE